MCSPPECTASIQDLCPSPRYLQPVTQTDFVYQIYDTPVTEIFQLLAFTEHFAQQDYGCTFVDTYTLQVDYGGSGFQDSASVTGVTFDAATLEVTLSISDGSKADFAWTYRLISNGSSFVDFSPTGCYVQLASFMVEPVASFILQASDLTTTVYTFESYTNTGGAACSQLSYELSGLTGNESWMQFSLPSPGTPNPSLSVTQSASGIAYTSASFAMAFSVVDSSGTVFVNEPFTLEVTDCRDAVAAGLAFDLAGPVIDSNGIQSLFYD